MAVKEKVKGICDTSKCNYDVYTSEKVDELLAGVVGETFLVKTVSATIENVDSTQYGQYSKALAFIPFEDIPGFNKNNTIVVSVTYSTSGVLKWTGNYNRLSVDDIKTISTCVADNRIEIKYEGKYGVWVGNTIRFYCVLMKTS